MAYDSSKTAVNAITLAYAKELRESAITVNITGVSPTLQASATSSAATLTARSFVLVEASARRVCRRRGTLSRRAPPAAARADPPAAASPAPWSAARPRCPARPGRRGDRRATGRGRSAGYHPCPGLLAGFNEAGSGLLPRRIQRDQQPRQVRLRGIGEAEPGQHVLAY